MPHRLVRTRPDDSLRTGPAPVIVSMTTMALQCPACLSKDIRRSRSESIFAIIRARFGQNPYRCRSCRKQFFRSGNHDIGWEIERSVALLAKLTEPADPAEPRSAIASPVYQQHVYLRHQTMMKPMTRQMRQPMAPQGEPWWNEVATRHEMRSSLAVRKRDWAQLLARGRVA